MLASYLAGDDLARDDLDIMNIGKAWIVPEQSRRSFPGNG
ncbi:hypothetical protein V474_13525 [Novosphingobium barchaimii LL02]|uniref:Uncharacterized protein n=1 Tax=Novosphingobium barchaimii LL02 TaxID=1114963 RepID=A0A0J7XYP1_9SPHN|nr:hypothetical protein V474_13525 [Novosphingobium barchaimii LL02]